jgi:hypothetical protein
MPPQLSSPGGTAAHTGTSAHTGGKQDVLGRCHSSRCLGSRLRSLRISLTDFLGRSPSGVLGGEEDGSKKESSLDGFVKRVSPLELALTTKSLPG